MNTSKAKQLISSILSEGSKSTSFTLEGSLTSKTDQSDGLKGLGVSKVKYSLKFELSRSFVQKFAKLNPDDGPLDTDANLSGEITIDGVRYRLSNFAVTGRDDLGVSKSGTVSPYNKDESGVVEDVLSHVLSSLVDRFFDSIWEL